VVGGVFYDSLHNVGGFIYSGASELTDIGEIREADIKKTAFDIKKTFTPLKTWDKYSGEIMSGTLETANEISLTELVDSLVKSVSGEELTGLFEESKLVADKKWHLTWETLYHGTGSVIRLATFAPDKEWIKTVSENETLGDELAIRLTDVSGGSSVAEFSNFDYLFCESFDADKIGSNQLDIIWIVDYSGTMSNEIESVFAATEIMADKLKTSGVDWRIAVAPILRYTDEAEGRFVSEDRFTRDVEEFKGWVTDEQDNTASEDGLHTAMKAIEKHPRSTDTLEEASKIRKNAKLIVISLSDEMPSWICGGSGSGDCTFNEANYNEIKNVFDKEKATFYTISKIDDRKSDFCSGGGIETIYSKMAQETGGVSASICDTDQSQNIENIIVSGISKAGHTKLSGVPISASIRVSFQNSENKIEYIPRNKVNGFDFVAVDNKLLFFGDYSKKVGEAKEIFVSYRVWGGSVGSSIGESR